ncbi:hypothetical protein ACIQU6_34955 [Streptomyces sp. NPDC090442]|uniref:hypothetical protein n=1 Tax=Streptomyces sp. NPDC090442 TaxID=3365962 RepID=UPI0037F31453
MTIHYAYAIKALPDEPATAVAQPDEPQLPAQDDARPWAGDAYDEGDETDPTDAFARFAGQDGEEAWLDRASDGTLTGWVRDATGQVWRYSDDRAWALDVDGAQMHRAGLTRRDDSPDSTPGIGEPASSKAPDPSGDGPGAGSSTDAPALEGGLPAAVDEAGHGPGLDPVDPDVGESASAPEDDQDDDPDVPFPGARKPKKKGAM